MRHKWNGKPIGNGDDYKGGLAVACVNCGCVKEIIGGKPTYFLKDTVYEKAPLCKPNKPSNIQSWKIIIDRDADG